MGIETKAEHGGAEASFTSAIVAIEELARIDPSVSVMCDVHNTLVNTILRTYGTEEQQQKWLPLLAQSQVRPQTLVSSALYVYLTICIAWLFLSLGASEW
jgi:alkylation response protein AidB-like acyl-CoA dehydrogenase